MQQGPFTGVFRRITGSEETHPPALAVSVSDRTAYKLLVKIVQKESFLRVRQMDDLYQRLVLNTVGDAPIVDRDPLGRLDYERCALNMSLEFKAADTEIKRRLDNSPVWQFMFVCTGMKERLAVVVDKETEEIKVRKRHV